MSLISFVLALVLFLTLLAAVPFSFRVSYQRAGEDDSIAIVIKGFFGLLHYAAEIPSVDLRWSLLPHLRLQVREQQDASTREIKPRAFMWPLFQNILGRLFGILRRLSVVKRWFYRGIECRHLHCILEVGLPDPAQTGMMVGGLWSLIGYFLGKMHNNITFNVAKPQVAVHPSFKNPHFKADIDCIFKVRIGHIIIGGYKVLRIVKFGLRGVKFNESPN